MTEADDLEAVLDELTKYDFVDRTRIFLSGISQGVFFDCGGARRQKDIQGMICTVPPLLSSRILKKWSWVAGRCLKRGNH